MLSFLRGSKSVIVPSAISTQKQWSQTGWVGVDGEGDVTHITAHFNGEGGLGDELTGIGAADAHA
ncbi:hypothetical protein BSPWISOXPB_9582 [uncultured Gammaproteobacteria bacterium]|nr:hypothetical protein BSPWISOXPB_9582 [uncultured Gammaproteobacteria bacterium]